MHTKKAQTATEYLVITAVVIIIALIVVGVLGGIPGLGGNISEQEIRLKLQIQDIGVTDYVSDSLNTRLWLTNNKQQNVRIEGITVNGKKCSIRSVILRAGQNQQVDCWGVKNYDTSEFRFPITITYSDVQTGVSFTINDTSVPLVGTGLGGTRLHTGQQTCYVDNSDTEQDCSNAAAEGQDGNVDGVAKSYSDQGDNVLLDDHTGLYWTTNESTSITRVSAISYCDGLTQGGHSDWRLPNNLELNIVLNNDDATNLTPSQSWATGDYWSTTTQSVGATTYYWRLVLQPGVFYFSRESSDSAQNAVCVRGEVSSISLSDIDKNFVENGDGTVTDSNMGIIWEKELSNTSTLDWQQAIDHCEALTKAGFSDWRLPTVNEGSGLIDYGSDNASNYYPDVFNSPGYYDLWTGTSVLVIDYAYTVLLDEGRVNVDDKSLSHNNHARCVRDHN